jgi:ABC-type sugar transport system substrate-binding protein
VIRRRARIRKGELAGGSGFVLAVGPALATFVALLVGGVGVDRTTGISGVELALLTFAVAQHQTRRPPTRRVVFLAKSRSSFARNIFRGLIDGLEPFGAIHVRGLFPEPDEDSAAFQLRCLCSLEALRAHAVVVIPATEDEQIWRELARLMSRRTVVICVDTKPPNLRFRQQGLAPPLFVGSDFTAGGRTVGRYLGEWLERAPGARLIVAIGPESSWPARERASWVLYELAGKGQLGRCSAVELNDWSAPAGAAKLFAAVEAAAAQHGGELIVFTGNDKLAFELGRLLDRHAATLTVDVRLVGYDGTTTEDGRPLLDGQERALVTVDALPLEQGRAAAEFVAWAYEGHAMDVTKRIVLPRLVELGDDGESDTKGLRADVAGSR